MALNAQILGSILKRVLVVHRDLLLGIGIESLLEREKDLLVMGIAITSNMNSDIENFHPNVIVLDETLSFGDLNRIFETLQDGPELRVMVINLQNNHVTVYDKREISITQSNDLIYAIKQNRDLVD